MQHKKSVQKLMILVFYSGWARMSEEGRMEGVKGLGKNDGRE